MMKPKKNLAAIDVGTNSFHLIVVEVHPSTGRFRILDREKEIVRLGSGSTDMKVLSARAMDRGVRTLRRFKHIADALRAPVRAIATSAVREALNRQEFIRRVRAETGIKVEIASGPEEARLIHLGVLQALPVYHQPIFMIDIGGGSTEFLVGRGRRIMYSNSLKIGAVRLTERFFRGRKLEKRSVRECRRFVRGMLAPVVRSVEPFEYALAVGSSGTIANIASMIRLARGADEDLPLSGTTFSRRELGKVVDTILARTTVAERRRIGGLDPSRADIIVAGALILDEIFNEFGLASLTVSDFALREGVILDTIEKWHTDGRSRHLSDIRASSVRHVADQFHVEHDHARQVARLALMLFDQTAAIHGLRGLERGYLEAAAWLHEVGLYVSHTQHHRHSYYLIRNSDILGFTENEKEIIANVARYHRKSHPKEKHDAYRLLADEDRTVVDKLAALLRIADGLDRTHSSAVKSLSVRRTRTGIRLAILPSRNRPLDMEIWGADQKKKLFEETFGMTLRLAAA